MSSSSVILDVHQLVKTFIERSPITGRIKNQFTALDHVSFKLHEGEVLGILGPNGAGKTTLMQILLNVMTPTRGNITFFDKDFYAHQREILMQLGFASTYVQLPGNLTIYENLSIYAQLYGITGVEQEQRIKQYLDQFGMWHARHKLCGHLSAGQMTRTVLAKAFMTRPKVVLLDEPTASLDPDIAIDVRNFIIRQQREFGVSVIITSHDMAEVAEVCDRVIVLKRGKIIANNTPEKLAASIAEVRIELTMSDPSLAEKFLQERGLLYSVNKQVVSIEVKEPNIPKILAELGKHDIHFSHIVIQKPTLEDYFLHIARAENAETL